MKLVSTLSMLGLVLTVGAAHAQTPPEDPPAPPAADPAPAPAPEPVPVVVAPAPVPAPAPALDEVAIGALVDKHIIQQRTAEWNDGYYIRTLDNAFKLRIGGYMQYDGRFFFNDDKDPHTDQFVFRSIRPELLGTVFEHFDFRLLPDFGQGKTVIQDAYVDVHYSDKLEVRFGKFKAFGLERLQKEVATTFTERGLPTLLTPNRTIGVQVFGVLGNGIFDYSFGVFDATPDNGSIDGDNSDHKTGIARFTLRPFAATKNPWLSWLAIGGGGTYGWEAGTVASPGAPSYQTAGGTSFFSYKNGATSLVDTTVAAGRHWRATANGAYYGGPVGLVGEYVRSVQHEGLFGSNDIATFDAFQVLGQLVLTGEKASYNSVTPKHPFDGKGHYGAWDLAARFGEWRLVDGDIYQLGFADLTKSAHRVRSFGAGIDWFANKAFRCVLDFEHTWYWLGGPTGNRPSENVLIGRVQTVF